MASEAVGVGEVVRTACALDAVHVLAPNMILENLFSGIRFVALFAIPGFGNVLLILNVD